jgi:anhydro-N-acetylmuramic acid kinase
VGLISGTSMDGVDAALVRLSGPASHPRVRLLAFLTVPYAPGQATSAGELSQLNFLLGELFADAALRVCRRGCVSPKTLSVIGSHGQTIYHQGLPSRLSGREISSTLQVAEPSVIAERTGVPVVFDFRTADIAAGGEGAPLVPMMDYLALRHPRL